MFSLRRSRPTASAEVLTLRELDRRVADGLDVSLDRCEVSGNVCVSVHDRRTEVFSWATVAPECAMHAFRHPFAYVEAAA
jgi:hypothetical protein